MSLDLAVICRVTDPDERWREAISSVAERAAEVWLLDVDAVTTEAGRGAARLVPVDDEGIRVPEEAALRACRTAWILWLEPDEIATPGLFDRLLRLDREGALERMGAYRLTVCTVVAGRKLAAGGSPPRSSLRLFRRDGSRFAPRPGAEFIAPPAGRPLGRLRETIEETPFRDFDSYLRRIDRQLAREFAGGWPPSRSARLVTAWPATFVRLWILAGGWRDGRAGALWAGARASAAFMREMRIWVEAR